MLAKLAFEGLPCIGDDRSVFGIGLLLGHLLVQPMLQTVKVDVPH